MLAITSYRHNHLTFSMVKIWYEHMVIWYEYIFVSMLLWLPYEDVAHV